MRVWYVDTNVLIGAATGRSPAALAWFDQALDRGEVMVASRFLEVEAKHLVANAGGDPRVLDDYLRDFHVEEVDAALMHEAIAVPGRISGADAIHLATALRVVADAPIIATHDAQFARAAQGVALAIHDPITDDEARPPLATVRLP